MTTVVLLLCVTAAWSLWAVWRLSEAIRHDRESIASLKDDLGGIVEYLANHEVARLRERLEAVEAGIARLRQLRKELEAADPCEHRG